MSAGFPSPSAQRQTSFPKGPQQDIPMDTSSSPSDKETHSLFSSSSSDAPKSLPAFFTTPNSLFNQEQYISKIKDQWASHNIDGIEIYYLSSIISAEVISLVKAEVSQPGVKTLTKSAKASQSATSLSGKSVKTAINHLMFTAVSAFVSKKSPLDILPTVLDHFMSSGSNRITYSPNESTESQNISGESFYILPTGVKAFLLILVSIYFETSLSLQDVFKKHNIDLEKKSTTVNDETPIVSILGQNDAQFLVDNILGYALNTQYPEVDEIYQIALKKLCT